MGTQKPVKKDKFSTPTAWMGFHQLSAVELHGGKSFPVADVHTLLLDMSEMYNKNISDFYYHQQYLRPSGKAIFK
jgi:hypothetical protein